LVKFETSVYQVSLSHLSSECLLSHWFDISPECLILPDPTVKQPWMFPFSLILYQSWMSSFSLIPYQSWMSPFSLIIYQSWMSPFSLILL
jgi:hypothetical protein